MDEGMGWMAAWRGDVGGVVRMTGDGGEMAAGGAGDGDRSEGGAGAGKGAGATEVVEGAGGGGSGVEGGEGFTCGTGGAGLLGAGWREVLCGELVEVSLVLRLRACSTTGAVSLHTGKSPGLRLRLARVAMSADSTNLRLCSMLEVYIMVGSSRLKA